MPPIPSSGKRAALTLETKIKILQELEKKRRSRADIAKEYNLAKSSLFTIIKNRDKILASKNSGLAPERIRTTEAKYPKMETALVEWLKIMRTKNVPVDGNVLKTKAETFALRMDFQEFKASDGWLQRFKQRHGLNFRKLCGESASVDPFTVSEWRENRLKRLLLDYDATDIYNADETALFFKLLPDRSLVFKGEGCNGGKKAKDRITVLLACNMTGTDKLPLFVIGIFFKPRCFKGIRNSKAWMTAVLFEGWVRELDRKMAAKGRKILLVIDNCTAHGEIENLQAIRIEFLPPNVTSVMQPLDQGIIQSWKKHYRRMLLNRMILNLDCDKEYIVNLLGAIHLANAAWLAVKEATIVNCYRHAGFKVPDTAESSDSEDVRNSTSNQSADEEGDHLLQRLREHVPIPEGLNFSDYANVDSNTDCAEEPSEEDIIQQVLAATNRDEDNSSSSEDEEDAADVTEPRPSSKQAADSVRTLRRYFEGEPNSEESLKSLTDLENSLCKSVRFKQVSITSFLQKDSTNLDLAG